ncbi:DUF4266 domain-containing protein [Pseudomonadota bacterium]
MKFEPRCSSVCLTLIMLGTAVTACAPVQPWERGRLAQPQMALEGDPLLSAMDRHIYTSKEAASGGVGPSGGGCGCN